MIHIAELCEEINIANGMAEVGIADDVWVIGLIEHAELFLHLLDSELHKLSLKNFAYRKLHRAGFTYLLN
jgi:hypothetical protein